MLAEFVRGVERRKAGLTDPLADHLAGWAAALGASGATAKHVRQTATRARRLARGCGSRSSATCRRRRARWVAGLRSVRVTSTIPAGSG